VSQTGDDSNFACRQTSVHDDDDDDDFDDD